jgi:hypothetical protein
MANSGYDIFEKLPDGTLVWHGSVQHVEVALHRMVDLKMLNANQDHEFFTLYSSEARALTSESELRLPVVTLNLN